MIPEGTHIARCTHVLNIGCQRKMPTLLIGWELLGVLEDGKPATIFREFLYSLSRYSSLRPWLESWRGRPFLNPEFQNFVLEDILGAWCNLTILHRHVGRGRIEAQPATISPTSPLATLNLKFETVYYEFEEGRNLTFDLLPKWIQDKIENCDQWKHPAIKQEIPEDMAP